MTSSSAAKFLLQFLSRFILLSRKTNEPTPQKKVVESFCIKTTLSDFYASLTLLTHLFLNDQQALILTEFSYFTSVSTIIK